MAHPMAHLGASMSDLTAFLLARIAEDEAEARDTLNDALVPWNEAGQILYRAGWHAERASNHIDRWNPVRVLAECEAKRRIVEYHIEQRDRATRGDERDRALWSVAVHQTATVVETMVQVYADHPDYDEAWRA
jgi:hypothetical protein